GLAFELQAKRSLDSETVWHYVRNALGNNRFWGIKDVVPKMTANIAEWLTYTKPVWAQKTIAYMGKCNLVRCPCCLKRSDAWHRLAVTVGSLPLCDDCAANHGGPAFDKMLRSELAAG